MSEVRQTTGDEWTPEACERLLALMVVHDPWWYRPLLWILTYVPGLNGARTRNLRQRLDRYQEHRAVRIHREHR